MSLNRLSERYNTMSTFEQDFVYVSWVNALKVTVTFLVVLLAIRRVGVYSQQLVPRWNR